MKTYYILNIYFKVENPEMTQEINIYGECHPELHPELKTFKNYQKLPKLQTNIKNYQKLTKNLKTHQN